MSPSSSRRLVAAAIAVAVTALGVFVSPALATTVEPPVEAPVEAPVLTSFAPVDERRDFGPGESAVFSFTFDRPTATSVDAVFRHEDGTRLHAFAFGGASSADLNLRRDATGGTYRLDMIGVGSPVGGWIVYHADGSVTAPAGVSTPERHDMDLTAIAVNYVGSTGESRAPEITSVRRSSTSADYPSGTTVLLEHTTNDTDVDSVMVRYQVGYNPASIGAHRRAPGLHLHAGWGVGATYTAVQIDARDTYGNTATYHPDGRVTMMPPHAGGPTSHTLDFDALTFRHVPANPPVAASSAQRDWTHRGTSAPDLLARTPDGRLMLYPGTGTGAFGRAVQVGKGWAGMASMTQVANLSGTGTSEVVAVDGATGRLHAYPGTGRGTFAAPRQLGRGWAGMDLLVGVHDWVGRGTSGLIARQASSGQLLYYGADGRGGLRAGVVIGRGWSGMDTIVAAGDWDGDGSADLIARQRATGDLYLYRGNGAGGFLGSRLMSRSWGDYDSFTGAVSWTGADVEVLARHTPSGELQILRRSDLERAARAPLTVGRGFAGYTLVS